MLKHISILTILLALSMAATGMAQPYTVHERNSQLTQLPSSSGAITFVITSDDPARALRTLQTARSLEQKGTRTTVLFAEEGVRLASSKKIYPRKRSSKKNHNSYDIQVHAVGPPPITTNPFGGNAANIRRSPLEIAILQNDFGVDPSVFENINYSGKVMACPRCMQTFGVQKANLREGIEIAPASLVRSIHFQ